MNVGVLEARYDHAAADVDHLGGSSALAADIGLRAYGDDPPVSDGAGGRPWLRRIEGVDGATDQGGVGNCWHGGSRSNY
jgi:hypothetical protein